MIFCFVSCENSPIEPKHYTVTFNTDGGSEIAPAEVEDGKTVAKPVDPTKEGFTFAGWYLAEAEYNFDTAVTADITLNAKWNSIVSMVRTEAELKAAIVAADKKIVLTSDLELDKELIIDGGKTVTLDLNKKSIKFTSANGIISSGKGTELLISNGTVEAARNTIIAKEDGKITINSGKYISVGNLAINAGQFYREDGIGKYSNGSVVINNAEVYAPEFAVVVFGESKLVINDGTFNSADNAVVGTNGSKEMKDCKYDITINGGTFNGAIKTDGYIACGIYMANTGKVTLNGGTFNIEGGIGVLVRSGDLEANKVTINLKEKAGLTEGKVGDSSIKITTSSQIVINDATYPGAAPTISKNETGYVVKNIDGTEYAK